MRHFIILLIALIGALPVAAQEVALPIDFRQHNLTEYNSSLLSPIFSLDRSQPQSLALWTRWQWQSLDGDPTTFFMNYTRRINSEMAGGLAIFQHNTGTFVNRGGVLNYAYATEITPNFEFAAGLNLFGYQRQLADDRFVPNPDFDLPQFGDSDDFIVQLAPSARLRYGPVSLGVVVENFIEYNLNTSESQVSNNGNIVTGLLAYRLPLEIFPDSGESYLQPTLYYKRLPDFDNQVGITALLSTPKFWAQAGFNNFYGISGGIGGRFFKNFSIGALIEYGTDSSLQDQDPSFELVTAYNFGSQIMRRRIVGFKVKDDQEILVDADKVQESLKEIPIEKPEVVKETKIDKTAQLEKERAEFIALQKKQSRPEKTSRQERKRRRDSLRMVKLRNEELARELEQQRLDSITYVQKEAARKEQVRRRLDSIRKREAEIALAEQKKAEQVQRRLDSVRKREAELALAEQKKAEREAAAKKATEVTLEKGEKYEEAVNEEGLSPGFYLIANVFGTKRYYDAFMKSMKDRGLNPKSFYRAKRKWNYVYLGKYNTIQEARKARNSQLNGRYKDKLWIFRVVVD